MTIEININCDLGEKSKHHLIKNDPKLLEIVNSANIACGFHAGDEESMNHVIEISKKNGVSIGAHPSFNDPENFGRKRINLDEKEINKLLIDQYEILQTIAEKHAEKVTHIKPHGALNNMAMLLRAPCGLICVTFSACFSAIVCKISYWSINNLFISFSSRFILFRPKFSGSLNEG